MAKSIEVAYWFLKKSIERGMNDEEYYMDYVKVHKLMYLGQCYLKYERDMDLFEEDVFALSCGPYIDKIELVAGCCGFDKIKNVDELKESIFSFKPFSTIEFPLSISRNETCDVILDKFGKLTTDELVFLTKNTEAYKRFLNCCNNVISKSSMGKTGEILFKEKDKEFKKVKLKI